MVSVKSLHLWIYINLQGNLANLSHRDACLVSGVYVLQTMQRLCFFTNVHIVEYSV